MLMAKNVFAGPSFGEKITGAGECVVGVWLGVLIVLAKTIVPNVMQRSAGCLTQQGVGLVAVTGNKDCVSISPFATVLKVSGPIGIRSREISVYHAGGLANGAITLVMM